MMTKFPINGSRVGYVDEAGQDVDEDDDVGDPVNSDVAADDNDEILYRQLRSRPTVKTNNWRRVDVVAQLV
ncbi:Os05g0296464 [Oryza sativa Japonica Group]|uniref:Os05g0296464 protein n=1 Tax=Oryza sativa subsp. japonica TaxID=39947 RepID=A0A0P0WKB7_ORYSJ|nr:Os05g0296464 [Oryza sativa Japonica Group]